MLEEGTRLNFMSSYALQFQTEKSEKLAKCHRILRLQPLAPDQVHRDQGSLTLMTLMLLLSTVQEKMTPQTFFYLDLRPGSISNGSGRGKRRGACASNIPSTEVISETGWVVDSSGPVVRYNLPPRADEWLPHSTSNWIIWRAFSSMNGLVMQSTHTASAEMSGASETPWHRAYVPLWCEGWLW